MKIMERERTREEKKVREETRGGMVREKGEEEAGD